MARFPPLTKPVRPVSEVSMLSVQSNQTITSDSTRDLEFSRLSSNSGYSEETVLTTKGASIAGKPVNAHKQRESDCTIEMPKPLTIKKSPRQPATQDQQLTRVSDASARSLNSFAIRSIDLLISQNPCLEVELNLLKRTIAERESDIENAKHAMETDMHRNLWDACLKIEKMEKRLEGKTAMVSYFTP